MLDTTNLKGTRVKVRLTNDTEVFGVLKGITSEKFWIGEVGVDRDEVADIEPAPLICSNCHRSQFRLFDETGVPLVNRTDGICANCYRAEAARRPATQEPCEVCGAPGVRNVRVRRSQFLCARHHAETGEGLLIHPSASAAIAECATEDVTSPKHEWGQVRGARFRCVRCKKAEKWDPELLAELDRLRG